MAPERDALSEALGIQARSLEPLERTGCVDAFLGAGEWSPRVTFHADRRRLGTAEMRLASPSVAEVIAHYRDDLGWRIRARAPATPTPVPV